MITYFLPTAGVNSLWYTKKGNLNSLATRMKMQSEMNFISGENLKKTVESVMIITYWKRLHY
jgi:hypothetical protein